MTPVSSRYAPRRLRRRLSPKSDALAALQECLATRAVYAVDRGVNVASLKANDQGDGSLILFDRHGQPRIALTATPEGGKVIAIDRHGRPGSIV